jgi:orotidine-5'-phosphate decarboxylase
MPLLIPGIGAQGGDLGATIRAAGPSASVINSSRDILYAGTGEDFDQAARAAAIKLRDSIRTSIDTSIRDATHGAGTSSHTNPQTT